MRSAVHSARRHQPTGVAAPGDLQPAVFLSQGVSHTSIPERPREACQVRFEVVGLEFDVEMIAS